VGLMAKWGNVDFKQLKDLQRRLNRLQKVDLDRFCEDCAKELAARLLSKVIRRTPVGNYTGGGTLRRGWTAATEAEAAGGARSNAKAYVESLRIMKTGNVYQVEIVNPVHYVSYVEYGHRTVNHKGWVEGRFMLTISENELDNQAPAILEKKLLKYLGEAFNA
jgi:hypothetical protein